MKTNFIALYLLIISIGTISCQKQRDSSEILPAPIAGKEMVIEEGTKKEIALNDSLSFIGNEALYKIIGQDSAIVKDASVKLYLYLHHHYARTIGKRGKGPNEYASADDIDFYNDTLFVLDNASAKIIGYSITTGKCVYELLTKTITDYGITSLVRLKGTFLLGNCRYVPSEFRNAKYVSKDVKGSEDLFLIMDDRGNSKSIGPKRADIEFFDIFPVSCPTWGKAMKVQNNQLFACIPLAKSAIRINLADYSFQKLPIYLDIANPKTKITYANITLNGLEIAEEIFPFNDNSGYAIASKTIANNKAKRLIRVYDAQSKSRGYIIDKHSEAFGGSTSSISDVTPQTFTTFYAHRPEDKSVFPYSLLTQNYH